MTLVPAAKCDRDFLVGKLFTHVSLKTNKVTDIGIISDLETGTNDNCRYNFVVSVYSLTLNKITQYNFGSGDALIMLMKYGKCFYLGYMYTLE